MSAQETAREIADQAAEWWSHGSIAGVGCADTDDGLRRWLDGNPRRKGALLRAEAALSFVDRARALAGVIPKPAPRPIWVRRKFLFAGAALAAGLVGVVVLMTPSHRYGTDLGEVRQVPLSDGTLYVAINTQSAVEVVMHADRREVTLTRGEAWFQVAHDKQKTLHRERRSHPGACRGNGVLGTPARRGRRCAGHRRGGGDMDGG